MLRYHGGKWKMASWIISHLPSHRVYVEPFGGAASVLLRKERSHAEVYNDMDGEVVNLFRCVRERGEELRPLVELTPFSRAEYRLSFELADCPLEQARRTLVRSYMGFGSNSLSRGVKSGFRANSTRSGTTPAMDWRNWPKAMVWLIERTRGVVIECRPALDVMRAHDGAETLHYVDPPYVHSTRSAGAGKGARKGYTHEMSDEEHRELASCLLALCGKVVLSGYSSSFYEELFSDWRRVERRSMADGARSRREVLWMNFSESEVAA